MVRLNNYAAVSAAYGDAAAAAAMDHLCGALRAELPAPAKAHVERDEIELLLAHYPLKSFPMAAEVDRLCAALAAMPFHHGGQDILLSLSAGYGVPGGLAAADEIMRNARATLAAAIQPQESLARRCATGVALYREDMAQAALLVERARQGGVRFAWQPVVAAGDRGAVLHHEALLRVVGRRGEPMDGAEAYAALSRIGLAPVADRMLLSAVLDELERDPAAVLSLPISARSLSLNLHGRALGWTDLFARLTRQGDVARRLIVEIVENGRIASLADAQAFVAALRATGVRVAVAGFGCGYASIRDLQTLSPDMIKLHSAFMRTAGQLTGDGGQVRHLVALARTISPLVIVTGIDAAAHLQLALAERPFGMSGSGIGRPSADRRGGRIARVEAFLPSPGFHERRRRQAHNAYETAPVGS
ncbi:EAL domain-containing protein [Sphingobium bisphenolivorans]|uniref:EAL domain-containing protein n=1 Tax=Sphingobium bisphenolivorans TaxID=1335760 RepID=UPI0003B63FE7|nr:EAL domain-containing protein [Sphingobium bisphenolivorans]